MDFPVNVSKSLNISMRLFSCSLVDTIAVLHPTPLCHIAYDTLPSEVESFGIVKPV